MYIDSFSIKAKIRLLVTSSLILVASSLAFSMVFYEIRTYKEQNLEQLEVIVNIVADRSAAALVFQDSRRLNENVSSLKLRSTVLSACVYDINGKIKASFSLDYYTCPDAPPVENQALYVDDFLLITNSITLDGEVIGFIHVRSSLQELNSHITRYTAAACIASFILIILAIYLSGKLEKRIIAPLEYLTITAEKVANDKNYGRRVNLKSEDEVGALAKTFNTMLSVIETQNENLESEVAKQTMELRQANSKLIKANDELKQFSGSVAHDLSKPLRSIHGVSQIVLDTEEEISKTGKDLIFRIQSEVLKMGQLIDSMLRLSEIFSKERLNIEKVNLSAIASTAVRQLHEQNPDKHYLCQIPPGISVYGDKTLLGTALTNLIDNAWKYSSKNEIIKIWFGWEAEEDRIVYYVRDEGTGFDVDPEEERRIFLPFNRLHNEDEFPGKGVGLATVQRVIERHGGKVWGVSKKGEGSTFYFTIPQADVY